MTKQFRLQKLYTEDKAKLDRLTLDISSLEGKRVSNPETLRRIMRIPKLPDVLREDAFLKKIWRKNVE